MNFPSKCPYCGKDTVQDCVSRANDLRGNIVEIHKCIHCSKPIFAIKKIKSNGTWAEEQLIHYYPTVSSVDFPKRIIELSPTAFKTYEQAIKAKEQGFDILIGAGLRIALEWLVWDYLIKVKGCKEAELENLKLYQRIEKINGNFYTDVCARLIRLFGNDSVHIVKQLDFSVDEVIEAFEFLCALIDSELKINEVHSRLNKKP